MTTTASHLEAMTDHGRFELLATGVLRKADPRYAAIIHTGVNAAGETIKAPVDGIQIPGSSPPHYVMVQHTTTDRSRLRGKWLTNQDADMGKAVKKAAEIRLKEPDAEFTLVLCTNQRVAPKLLTDVAHKAKSENIGVDIWEQSRLADFLDTTGDGHWLRKLYLNIEAERLSKELLHDLCRKSMEAYWQEILLPGHNPLIKRTISNKWQEMLVLGDITLWLLIGDSGYGKSVIALQALQDRLNSGGFGLWLPARFIENAISVELALDAWLRELHSFIEMDAGKIALSLANDIDRLMVVVDDVNRTDKPTNTVRKLLSLAAPQSVASAPAALGDHNDKKQPAQSPVIFIAPVWPDNVQDIAETVSKSTWVQMITIGSMTPEEAVQTIQSSAYHLSEVEARDFADRLGRDPFIVGLFALMVDAKTNKVQLAAIAEDAIGRFIDRKLREMSTKNSFALLVNEYQNILQTLGQQMLLKRNLRPSWDELRSWFGQDSGELLALRHLFQFRHLCRLEPGAKGKRLVFRHDRLLERVLVDGMDSLLDSDNPPEDIITDPYFSNITGKSIGRKEYRNNWPQRLRYKAPLCLFEAIRHFSEPTIDHQRRIVAEAREWAKNDSQHAPDSLINAISWTLLETDSSQIIPIIDAMESNLVIMLAGLRNGSIRHGLNYLSWFGSAEFEPGMNDNLRDRIIAQAMYRHARKLETELHTLLEFGKVPEQNAFAVLSLLGHLRLPGFEDAIQSLWLTEKVDLLPYGIWAAARCPVANVAKLLNPMLDQLDSMRGRGNSNMPSQREYIGLYLSWAFRRGISEDAVQFMLARARKSKSLLDDVMMMLENVDHLDVIEVVVRQNYVFQKWSNLTALSTAGLEAKPLPKQIVQRLKELWEDSSEPDDVRKRAFGMWLVGTGCRDINFLRTIDKESPLFIQSLQQRIKLGDCLAAEDLLPQLNSAAAFIWWQLSRYIWGEKLCQCVETFLDSFKQRIPNDFSGGWEDSLFSIAILLQQIPPMEAERILDNHWDDLKFSPPFVQTAFRIGTPKCIELAEQGMAICPPDVDIFKHAFMHWDDSKAYEFNPLTTKHLDNLLPFLDRINEEQISQLAWLAERSSRRGNKEFVDWVRTHLLSRMNDKMRARLSPSDNDLIKQLEDTVNRSPGRIYVDVWLERFAERNDPPDRILRVLEKWLVSHPDEQGLRGAAECLKHVGSRHDLAMLNRPDVTGDTQTTERIKADAGFAVRHRSLA